MTRPASVVLVGRASYEIGDPEFLGAMRAALGEEERRNDTTGKITLTEDVDAVCTDETEEIVGIAHRTSYVAELTDCYLHTLTEQTLILPKGWQDRVGKIPGTEKFENLHLYRLHPLDFIVCKASAGRDKDARFLSVFIRLSGIAPADVVKKIDAVMQDPPIRLRDDSSAQFALASFRDKMKEPPPDQDWQEPDVT